MIEAVRDNWLMMLGVVVLAVAGVVWWRARR
jgi:LPXTG-motif cell wall-anchored protein